MKKYTIGLITGALLGISAMMFIGAQNKNLGNIEVTSITVRTPEGKKTVEIGYTGADMGVLMTYNGDGKKTVVLGTAPDGNGNLTVYGPDGKIISYLTNYLMTYNKYEEETGFFGTNSFHDGLVYLKDRYGKTHWTEFSLDVDY